MIKARILIIYGHLKTRKYICRHIYTCVYTLSKCTHTHTFYKRAHAKLSTNATNAHCAINHTGAKVAACY